MRPASGGPDRDRLGGPDHAVEHRDGDGDLALLARQRASAQPRADGCLVPADAGLRQAAPPVAGRPLPGHAPLVADEPDVTIPLARRRVAGGTRHRGRTWRDDDGRRPAGLPALDGLVDGLAVVGAIGYDARDLARDWVEQGGHLTGVSGLVAGQGAGDDLAGAGVGSGSVRTRARIAASGRASPPAIRPGRTASTRCRRSPSAAAPTARLAGAAWRSRGSVG